MENIWTRPICLHKPMDKLVTSRSLEDLPRLLVGKKTKGIGHCKNLPATWLNFPATTQRTKLPKEALFRYNVWKTTKTIFYHLANWFPCHRFEKVTQGNHMFENFKELHDKVG